MANNFRGILLPDNVGLRYCTVFGELNDLCVYLFLLKDGYIKRRKEKNKATNRHTAILQLCIPCHTRTWNCRVYFDTSSVQYTRRYHTMYTRRRLRKK